jgi:outer membrane biosynthesis protein TonB
MRKFILIAAMVLVSATAQAAGSRSLTLASNDEPAAAEPSKPVETRPADATPAEAPKYVERPSVVETTPEPPKAVPSSDDPSKSAKVEKPRRKHQSIEGQVISELHRHGVYW